MMNAKKRPWKFDYRPDQLLGLAYVVTPHPEELCDLEGSICLLEHGGPEDREEEARETVKMWEDQLKSIHEVLLD